MIKPFSPAFLRWFGQSKVVDDSGRPRVVYHGTTCDIRAFDLSHFGANDTGWYGAGAYLTADPETASAYANYGNLRRGGKLSDLPEGANVLPVYVSLQNPYFWPQGKQGYLCAHASRAFSQELMAQGYDGVIVSNEYQAPEYMNLHEIVVFKPSAIKSAIANAGSFCPQTADLVV